MFPIPVDYMKKKKKRQTIVFWDFVYNFFVSCLHILLMENT